MREQEGISAAGHKFGSSQGVIHALGANRAPSVAGLRWSKGLAAAFPRDSDAKERARWLFEHDELPIPKGACVGRGDWNHSHAEETARLVEKVPGPWVVKPVDQGSSVGIFFIDRPEQFDEVFTAVFRHSNRVLMEEQIVGDELTCGVLEQIEGSGLDVLSVTLIRPREDA